MIDLTSWFQQHDHFLLVTHEKPDGDALGSTMGLYHCLTAIGKDAQVVLPEGYNHTFSYIPDIKIAVREPKEAYETVIALDCGEFLRINTPLGTRQVHLNIDHHITNTIFGLINVVMPEMAATAELLAVALPQWGIPITADAAVCLYSAILSDTLGFRTTNTTSQTLRVAADLADLGAGINDLYRKALLTTSMESLNYWKTGLGKLVREDNLAWSVITMQEWKDSGYSGKDDAELANLIGFIDGVDIAVLLRELADGLVKVSWRSVASLDISGLAGQFGGGGHANAAGAEIHKPLIDVQSEVLEATRNLLAQVRKSQ